MQRSVSRDGAKETKGLEARGRLIVSDGVSKVRPSPGAAIRTPRFPKLCSHRLLRTPRIIGMYRNVKVLRGARLTPRRLCGQIAASSLSPVCFHRLDAGEPIPRFAKAKRGRGARRRGTGAKATFKAEPVS